MLYQYKNEETGKVIDREFSIKGDIPAFVEEDGIKYHRLYSSQNIIIPYGFGATNNRPKYGKYGPGGHKHFY